MQKGNKFGTDYVTSWMKVDEVEDEEEDSLLTSKEPFRMLTKLIIA